MKSIYIFSILLAGSLSAQPVINSISPISADPGTSGLTVTFTLPNTTPPTPPIDVTANSVTIGNISGTDITRTSLDTLTAKFDIPADAAEGTQNAVITFTVPSGQILFSNSNSFSIGEPSVPEEPVSEWNGPLAAGYNLFSPLNSKDSWLMDNDGNILKTWTSDYRPAHSLYLTEGGGLARTINSGSNFFDGGGAGGGIELYDWDGNLTWSFAYNSNLHLSHHDIEILPNGNILMIAWEMKTREEAVSAGRDPALLPDDELWPDHIIEVQLTGNSGGEIVWEWHIWDHLVQDYDQSLPGYGNVETNPGRINLNYVQDGQMQGAADWTHINSIDYNPELDQILLSVRNFSEIWIIDHNTTTAEAAGSAGDLLYRWGNPEVYDAGDAIDQKLFAQHDAKWIEDGFPGAGNILIFNNGAGRNDGAYSSVDEITPPLSPDGNYSWNLPVELVWTYTSEVPTDFYADHISGAQRLRNGNTLIADGPGRYAFEVTAEGTLVWDHDTSGDLFRMERYSPDFSGFANTELALPSVSYPIVDTAQRDFYDDASEIEAPESGEAFHGQDGTYNGNQPTYEISADGLTIHDYNTGLTWTRSHDWNGDGDLNVDDKMLQSEAVNHAAELNDEGFGGYSDWRLPSLKEIYSLMDFRGTDPNLEMTDSSSLTPFIDSDFFQIGYGDVAAGERIIDSQFATTTIYVDTVMNGQQAVMGLNLVDGRIKGYPTRNKGYYAYFCRGNPDYGINKFEDNGDGTVTDHATGLMWAQADSGSGMDWEAGLAYAEVSELARHTDWRLPNAKELQSLVDYSRSPGTTYSAAIDPLFSATPITNMAGEADYPWYWSGTTHLSSNGSSGRGVYVCFGRGTGTMDGGATIIDVHGAGCQRSDPKTGDPVDFPDAGNGPQGDVRRVYNFVRLVRDAEVEYSGPADALGGSVKILADGWFEHESLGQMTGEGDGNDAWLYSPFFGQSSSGAGWLWTNEVFYPYFYRLNDATWVWYLDITSNPCWFYIFNTGEWKSYLTGTGVSS